MMSSGSGGSSASSARGSREGLPGFWDPPLALEGAGCLSWHSAGGNDKNWFGNKPFPQSERAWVPPNSFRLVFLRTGSGEQCDALSQRSFPAPRGDDVFVATGGKELQHDDRIVPVLEGHEPQSGSSRRARQGRGPWVVDPNRSVNIRFNPTTKIGPTMGAPNTPTWDGF